MNAKIYVLTTLAMCIGLLLTGFPAGAGQIETSVTLSVSGVIQQTPTPTPTPTPTEPYSYIISVSGSNYQMTDGTTGQIVFQSTNSSQVFSNVVGNCSVGSSIDVESGVYTVTTTWTILGINDITVNFENGATLVAGNGLDASVLMLWNSNNDVINGVTINGNAANQAATDIFPFNTPTGVFIGGSNDKVDNALIYNCRQWGVQVWVEPWAGSLGNAVHSGVINSKIYDCGWNGITFGSPYDVNCYAQNNEIYGCSDVGISTYGVGTQITGNYIHDLNGTTGFDGIVGWGIGVEGGGNVLITGNTVQNCPIGIDDNGFNNCTISDNIILNSVVVGITCSGSYNSIINNHVTNVTDYNGIRLSASFNIVSGNHISQANYDGISIASTANYNTISLNYVFENGVFGVDIGGSNNQISQNQVYDNQWDGIIVESGATSNILSTNNVYGNTNLQIADLGTYTVTNAILQTSTVGATVAAGQVLYTQSNGEYYLANAVSTAAMNAVGLATQTVSSGGQCVIMNQGYFTNPSWSWTVGGALYVSSSTPGGLTQTQPSGSGNVIEYVGYAISATEIYFSPNQAAP